MPESRVWSHVLYFGDMDLAGDDIMNHLEEMKKYFGLEGIDFIKVGVESTSIKYHFDKMGLKYRRRPK